VKTRGNDNYGGFGGGFKKELLDKGNVRFDLFRIDLFSFGINFQH
jgi:hypothetical protein